MHAPSPESVRDGLSYLEYLQNNQAWFRNMALSHSDTPITDYSSAINARLILCTTRGIYNSQFGLIIQSLTCVYDGPLMEGGIGGGCNCQRQQCARQAPAFYIYSLAVKEPQVPSGPWLLVRPSVCLLGASSWPDKYLIDKALSLVLLFRAVCFYSKRWSTAENV